MIAPVSRYRDGSRDRAGQPDFRSKRNLRPDTQSKKTAAHSVYSDKLSLECAKDSGNSRPEGSPRVERKSSERVFRVNIRDNSDIRDAMNSDELRDIISVILRFILKLSVVSKLSRGRVEFGVLESY